MENLIEKTAEEALLMEGNEGCEISILLTDNAEIRRLNKLYRDVDKPTDVLAFAMREGVDGDLNQDVLGDVVISLPTAEHQASVYGHSFEEEILFLVSHGVLHLLGYEHDDKDDMLVMQRKQKTILRSLGYDPTRLGDIAVRAAEPVNGVERQVIRA
jgi:probable rRNA maturation factor